MFLVIYTRVQNAVAFGVGAFGCVERCDVLSRSVYGGLHRMRQELHASTGGAGVFVVRGILLSLLRTRRTSGLIVTLARPVDTARRSHLYGARTIRPSM
jgi:hypothetical protein